MLNGFLSEGKALPIALILALSRHTDMTGGVWLVVHVYALARQDDREAEADVQQVTALDAEDRSVEVERLTELPSHIAFLSIRCASIPQQLLAALADQDIQLDLRAVVVLNLLPGTRLILIHWTTGTISVADYILKGVL